MKKSALLFIFLAVSFFGFSESYWTENVFAYLNEFFEIKIDRFADDEEMAEDFESVRKSAQKISSVLSNPKSDKALEKLCKNDRTFRIISQRIAQKSEEILVLLEYTPPGINKSNKAESLGALRSAIKSDAQILSTYKESYLQISENYDTQKNKAVQAALFCLALLIFAFGAAILILKARLHRKSVVSKKITQILENERRRISRDLHDSVIQEIRSIKLESDRIKNDKISEISENTISELRSICYNLTPPDLNLESGATLEILLAGLCSDFQKNSKIKCIFAADENLPEIKSKDKMLTIFRIVQEALQNISEHSNAQNCSVVARNKGGLVIFITDDGNGFDLRTEMKKPFCFGLKTMFERAEQIGAVLTVESAAGDGTEIKLEIEK